MDQKLSSDMGVYGMHIVYHGGKLKSVKCFSAFNIYLDHNFDIVGKSKAVRKF